MHRSMPMSPFLSLTKICCPAHTEESDRDSDDDDDGTTESAGRVTDKLVNTYARNNPDARKSPKWLALKNSKNRVTFQSFNVMRISWPAMGFLV